MPNQTIPIATAEEMIKDYDDYMKKLGVDMKSQTQSVSFASNALMPWLEQAMQNADELRIFMGRYPSSHAKAGRTTVILWPYQNGQRTNAIRMRDGDDDDDGGLPFNDGSGNP